MSTPAAPGRATPPAPLTLAALMTIVGAALVWLSLRRYEGFNAGMLDLGNMYQAIASVLRGQPLITSGAAGNFSRLSGHVELIYVAFAPLVALWPDPRALLLAQAALAVSGAVPAYRLGRRRLDSPGLGLAVAAIYLFYPVMQTAVLFDFHGDTLAMPLLLWGLEALDRRANLAASIWLGLALLCKVYVAAPVAVLGAVLFLFEGRRRAGALIAGSAVLYGAVAFFLVRPLFLDAGGALLDDIYVEHYFGALDELRLTLAPRLLNAIVVFGPALLLALPGWRWLLPAMPLAGAALISTGPGGVYDYRYHHYAMVVPFVVMAAVAGAARRRAAAAAPGARPRRSWRADVVFSAAIVVLLCAVLVDQPLNPLFWLRPPGEGLDHSAYGLTPRDAVKERFLAEQVPPDAPMAASIFLASHIAGRETLYVTRYNDDPGGERLPRLLPQLDYVLADALFDWRVVGDDGGLAGGAAYERAEIGILLRDPAFGLVAMEDGLLLFQRDPAPGAALAQSIETVAAPSLPARPSYLGPAQLLGAQLEALGGRRYRASFEWRLSGEPPTRPWVAVSRIGGRDDLRVAHLPTYALLPISDWRPGQIVRESMELTLPEGLAPGEYEWTVAWHDAGHPEAGFADGRSLPEGVAPAVAATLRVP